MLNKIIKKYAHDFRDLAMSEYHLEGMLNSFKYEIKTDLLEIADEGEIEDLRRVVEKYFN